MMVIIINVAAYFVCLFKGTLHSKLALGFFSWPKSIYYCDLSLTNCTFLKLELRVEGTRFYGYAGEFDGRRGINLGIWCQ